MRSLYFTQSLLLTVDFASGVNPVRETGSPPGGGIHSRPALKRRSHLGPRKSTADTWDIPLNPRQLVFNRAVDGRNPPPFGNPGMIRFPRKYQDTMVSPWFRSGANGFRPSTVGGTLWRRSLVCRHLHTNEGNKSTAVKASHHVGVTCLLSFLEQCL